MSFSTDGYVEAQKRALIHIVCFALNAGIFGVAALNVTLCNPCFLRRMCILAPHGISDLIHEFARCESRTSYRELVVVFRAWMKVRGHDGAARSHYQRGMLMVERGREQRKGHVEFEKEKRKAFEKTFEETATLSTLATQSGGGNGAQGGTPGAQTRPPSALAIGSASGSGRETGDGGGGRSKPQSFFPSMPCSWQPERCRKLQTALSMPAWYQQLCESEARVGKEVEALAAEALRVEFQLIEAQKVAEDEVLKLINAQERWARIAPRAVAEALKPEGEALAAMGGSSAEDLVGATGAAKATNESTVTMRIREAANLRVAAQKLQKRCEKATLASKRKLDLSIVIQQDGTVGNTPVHDTADEGGADDASARSDSLKQLVRQLTPVGLPQLTPRPRRTLSVESTPDGARLASRRMSTVAAALSRRGSLHPAEVLIISLQARCEWATAIRDRVMARLAKTMATMGKLRAESDAGDGVAQLDELDIQNLASHTQRQLRQFARFLRSEAGVLNAMPGLFFQRCTHCVENSAPQTIGTHLLESGSGRTSYCTWLNKPLLRQKLAESDQHAQVSCLAWSPDAEMCAFGFVDGAVRVLDVPSMECIYALSETGGRRRARKRRSATLDAKKDAGISAMAFAQHNGWLAVGNADGNIVVWDTTTAGTVGTIVARVEVHAATISGLAFNRDSTFLASSSADATLRIFDAGTKTFDEIARIVRGETKARLESCAWSRDGKWIALAGADGEVTTYIATAPALEVPMHATMIGHDVDKRIHDVCFDGSGTLLASASEDRTARVWDVASGECVLILKGHQRAVSCCAFEHFSGGGGGDEKPPSTRERRASVCKKQMNMRPARRLLTGSLDGLILLWDIEAGAVLRAMQKHTAAIYCCAFSPDNAYIASGSFDRTIKLWLGETGEQVDDRPKTSTQTAAHGIPRGARGGGGESAHRTGAARTFNAVRLGTYKPQDANARENHHTDHVTQCAFTPTQLAPAFVLAATGGLDTTIRLWDRKTMCVLHELTDHSDAVTAICFADRLVEYAQPSAPFALDATRGGDRRRRRTGAVMVTSEAPMTEGGGIEADKRDDEDSIYTVPWAVLYTASDDGALYSWLVPPTTSASAAQPPAARNAPVIRHALSGHCSAINTLILFGETRLGSMLSCDESGLCIVWNDVVSENCPFPVATVDAAAQLIGVSTIAFALTSHYRSDGGGGGGGGSDARDDARDDACDDVRAANVTGASACANATLLIFTSNAAVLELRCEFPDVLCDDDSIAAAAETTRIAAADAKEATSAAAVAEADAEAEAAATEVTMLSAAEGTEDAASSLNAVGEETARKDVDAAAPGSGGLATPRESDVDDGDDDSKASSEAAAGVASATADAPAASNAPRASAPTDSDSFDIETRILMRGRALAWAPQSIAPLELKRIAPAAGSFAGGEVKHITSFVIADNCLCLAAGTGAGEVWFWHCEAKGESRAGGETEGSTEWSDPALLGAHSAGVSAMAFSPTPLDPSSGRKADRPAKLVTGSDDKTAIVWDLELGVRLATFVADGEVLCCNADLLGGWACGDTTGKLYFLHVEHITRGAVTLEVALQRWRARVWFTQKCAIARHERLNIRISNFFRAQLSLVDVGKSLDPTNPQVRHCCSRARAHDGSATLLLTFAASLSFSPLSSCFPPRCLFPPPDAQVHAGGGSPPDASDKGVHSDGERGPHGVQVDCSNVAAPGADATALCTGSEAVAVDDAEGGTAPRATQYSRQAGGAARGGGGRCVRSAAHRADAPAREPPAGAPARAPAGLAQVPRCVAAPRAVASAAAAPRRLDSSVRPPPQGDFRPHVRHCQFKL